jgi:hypothetical protein
VQSRELLDIRTPRDFITTCQIQRRSGLLPDNVGMHAETQWLLRFDEAVPLAIPMNDG